MLSLARRFVTSLASRRAAREARVLAGLKARYHGFRVLLADNEQALRLLAEFDRQRSARDGEALAETSRKLLDTAYDLIDGLNRLAESAYLELYDLHERLSAEIHTCLDETSQPSGSLPLCLRLDDPNAANRRYAGGKAASLCVLRRSGLPVPDGFVATTQASRRFLEFSGVDRLIRRCMGQVELGKSMEVAGREIADAVLAAALPRDLLGELEAHWQALSHGLLPPISMRSSAVVEDRPGQTFAGQFHTVLNVRTKEALVQGFREVVAGNFAARPTAYRRQAGLPLVDLDMAVLCQVMVPARASGVLFSVDPAAVESGRMLITAVPGLGTGAVGGELPADIFRPRRDASPEKEIPTLIAEKSFRDVADDAGGLRREAVSAGERLAPILDPAAIARLVHLAQSIESLRGGPQDIEWAIDAEGGLQILQARSAGLSPPLRRRSELTESGRLLAAGGVCASPGRAVGKVHRVLSAQDLRAAPPQELTILVLPMSLVEAARTLSDMDGVAVQLGNPADHLSCVARELGIPMVTALSGALEALNEGQWVVLDAEEGWVREAPSQAWSQLEAESLRAPKRRRRHSGPSAPAFSRLAELVLPLNLTDSYGPTFSALECRSVHDLIRFVHEMGILAMFDLGDSALEAAGSLPRYLEGHPLHFLILDLGGGLAPGLGKRRALSIDHLRCQPLRAVCRGMTEPGLRWRCPPPHANLSGMASRSLLDAGSARPVGGFNYALISRDYLNLNARVDFHFAMIDAVCGPSPGANTIYFRFKGGGTAREQRERRALLVSEILKAQGFFTDHHGDLVTAVWQGMPLAQGVQCLELLGRLMGFTRLLDAAMTDEQAVERAARAFMEGDYALERFEAIDLHA